MKNLDSYILEKLHLNKDTKINDSSLCEELSNIIRDYCQKTLKLNTQQYVTHCEDSKGNSTFNNSSNLARIYFWSKEVRDLDKFASIIAPKLDKVKKIKKTEVFATAIYFYFE